MTLSATIANGSVSELMTERFRDAVVYRRRNVLFRPVFNVVNSQSYGCCSRVVHVKLFGRRNRRVYGMDYIGSSYSTSKYGLLVLLTEAFAKKGVSSFYVISYVYCTANA